MLPDEFAAPIIKRECLNTTKLILGTAALYALQLSLSKRHEDLESLYGVFKTCLTSLSGNLLMQLTWALLSQKAENVIPQEDIGRAFTYTKGHFNVRDLRNPGYQDLGTPPLFSTRRGLGSFILKALCVAHFL